MPGLIGKVAAGMQHSVWDPEICLEIIEKLRAEPGALLPILHAVQDRFGHISEAAIPLMARVLNLSRAEVFGVVSFYHDFRTAPGGVNRLALCRAEACQAMGAESLWSDMLAALGISWGGTTEDGKFSVDAAYCLGLCACAPAAMFNGEPLARLTAESLSRIVKRERATHPVEPAA